MNEPSDLFERIYDKLHALAKRHFARQPASSTLQPTALVHEVYLRLARHDMADINDREHFLALAATAMRQILIDEARRRKAAKRGDEWVRVTLDGVRSPREDAIVDTLVLDDLITRLTALNPRHARVVELRVFAGMTVAEVARVLSVSLSTAEKDWRQARAWLRAELARATQT